MRVEAEQEPGMKLLIVDDHEVVREGLVALLRQLGPETEVLQARDSSEGLACAASTADLDAVFLDLNMPGLDGLPGNSARPAPTCRSSCCPPRKIRSTFAARWHRARSATSRNRRPRRP